MENTPYDFGKAPKNAYRLIFEKVERLQFFPGDSKKKGNLLNGYPWIGGHPQGFFKVLQKNASVAKSFATDL